MNSKAFEEFEKESGARIQEPGGTGSEYALGTTSFSFKKVISKSVISVFSRSGARYRLLRCDPSQRPRLLAPGF
jgi:hypothetical protein